MATDFLKRREVLAGGIMTTLALGSGTAWSAMAERSIFAGTALASNPLAASFKRVPAGLATPATTLLSVAGEGRLTNLRNPATLVSIWADWCGPCLAEMHDLAALRARHQGTGFEVIAVLQGSALDVRAARAKLDGLNAAALPSWIEPKGASIADALATPAGGKGFSLPCNLLLDRRGHVRARAFGSHVLTSVDMKNGEVTATGKQQLSHARTTWSLPAADLFARALADGLLDRV
ncbi:Thiol-disulfide isomerase or thioredoxin [Sphingomonas gellani]|uniref:Thiol-disulfide isomerase or thioredoxin n=1 Tax=Sphingomonas gellani TaxID=1166340 RepID=A0A1H8GRN0_9SPHN|nr:TlpA disulfide reductase family protein [Sphingomonas gellani]SEN46636.1 Thiol-disulfide isomerase or thioredoxin [Sphingomonas gellani]